MVDQSVSTKHQECPAGATTRPTRDAPAWLHFVVSILPASLGLLFLTAAVVLAVTRLPLRLGDFVFDAEIFGDRRWLAIASYLLFSGVLLAFARRVAAPSQQQRAEGPFPPFVVAVAELLIESLSILGIVGFLLPFLTDGAEYAVFVLILVLHIAWRVVERMLHRRRENGRKSNSAGV